MTETKEAPRGRRRGTVFVLAAVLVAGFVAVGVGGWLWLSHDRVQYPGGAMGDTFREGDSLMYVPLPDGQARRGDVVVFDLAGFGGQGLALRRVIAVGGDMVSCCNERDRITVNGTPIDEDYLTDKPSERQWLATMSFADVIVPSGHVFLAGDWRANSHDSRQLTTIAEANNGALPLAAVQGVVVGSGPLFFPTPIEPTTAFTDAGLPGTPATDNTFLGYQLVMYGGLVAFLLGLAGFVVALVRRPAPAGPPPAGAWPFAPPSN